MHNFLPAIGFSKLNKKSLDELIEEIKLRPDEEDVAIDFESNEFVEKRYMVADGVALVLRGTYTVEDEFIVDYYYPSFYGNTVSSDGDVEIIKQTDKDNYYAMCDEVRIGVSLIFQLQNMAEFLRRCEKDVRGYTGGIKLSALSTEGKILLPVYSSERIKEKTKINHDKKIDLVEQAREGDETAMESLALDEIDLYSKISRRILRQDILTIVSTYFMPYGIENDKYEILGEILEVKREINHITMEELCIMRLQCNDMELEVCINKKDLYGEPAVGRRFKGYIWLQGTVDFFPEN